MPVKKKYIIMISIIFSVFLVLLLSIRSFVTADTSSNQVDVAQTTSQPSEEVDSQTNEAASQPSEGADTQAKETSSVNISYDSVSGILSESALSILSGVSDESWSTLGESLVKVDNIQQKLEDTSLISYEDGKLIEILLLNCAINNDLIDSSQVSAAQDVISNALSSLSIAEKSKYSADEYSKLCSDSSGFGDYANKANSAVPEQIIMLNQPFKLNDALIMYDNKLLISIDDILQFINANVQYTDDSATISILSDNVLLEITRGTNTAYVNDKSTNINVPVLNISGKNYLSVEFFAATYEVGYEYIESQNTIILYSNLNQN